MNEETRNAIVTALSLRKALNSLQEPTSDEPKSGVWIDGEFREIVVCNDDDACPFCAEFDGAEHAMNDCKSLWIGNDPQTRKAFWLAPPALCLTEQKPEKQPLYVYSSRGKDGVYREWFQCPNCGEHELWANAKFCPICGVAITFDSPPAPVAVEPEVEWEVMFCDCGTTAAKFIRENKIVLYWNRSCKAWFFMNGDPDEPKRVTIFDAVEKQPNKQGYTFAMVEPRKQQSQVQG